jgi:2'-5' RNA ligase
MNLKIYNLRIVPPQPIYDEVLNFKNKFIEKFGKHPLSKSKPHVTLAYFYMDTQYEDKLIKAFDQLASIKRFHLGVGDFAFFPTVLILEISKTEEIDSIHAQTKRIWQQDLHFEKSALGISKPPHMTISRTKDKATLETSFSFFGKIGYKNEFEVDHLILTSRMPGKTWEWDHKIILDIRH